MPGLRFVTVRDLYDAYPGASREVGSEPSDEQSLVFLRAQIAKGAWAEAATYCVYLLPRREAVWWGCETLRRIVPNLPPADLEMLEAAETWVFEPEEARRIEALNLGSEGDGKSPATWMALAAGWSGGSAVPPERGNVPAPPDQTARALRAGLLIALAGISKAESAELLRSCLNDGIGLVVGDRVLAEAEE